MQLKLSAAAWLRERGVIDVEMEKAPADGYGFLDVLSRSRRIAIECGQCEARKLIGLAERGWLAVWLAYPGALQAPTGEIPVGTLMEATLIAIPSVRAGRALPPERSRWSKPSRPFVTPAG